VATWYELALEVPTIFDEIAAMVLFDLGTTGIETEVRGEQSILRAYFHSEPSTNAITTAISGYAPITVTPVLRRMADEEVDWSENWKLHFKPQPVGERLYVCPPWDTSPLNARIPIIINPGMAFGTGQHATTRGCITLIEELCDRQTMHQAADVGTGSGILAIVMAKLGVTSIFAIDNDPVACAATQENCDRNAVSDRVHVAASIDQIDTQCDLIVANLFANLLLEFAGEFTRLCTPNGILICSGMLEEDALRVTAGLHEHGWLPFRTIAEGPWRTIALQRTSR